MKVGILTFHWVFNYGANLQTLSSVGYFRKIGYEPIVLNWIPEDLEGYYLRTTSKEQVEMFRSFQNDFMPLSKLCRNSRDIAQVIKEEHIDFVFIGADTVFKLRQPVFSIRRLKWVKPNSECRFPNPYWGEFLNYGVNVPVLGFSIASNDSSAAEFKKETPEIYRYLQRFSFLTVRDIPTQEMVKTFSDGEIVPEITPDPVFNFNNNIDVSPIEAKVKTEFNLPDSYYLVCEAEPFNKRISSWVESLAAIIAKDGSALIELPRQTGKQGFNITQMSKRSLNPLEWYVVIKNARGYVGGLMHPLICCIHNKVPFFSLDYYGIRKNRFSISYQSSKVFQLLSECNLLRYYYSFHSKEQIPTPNDVYKELNGYDMDTLNDAAKIRQDKFISSMRAALNSIGV